MFELTYPFLIQDKISSVLIHFIVNLLQLLFFANFCEGHAFFLLNFLSYPFDIYSLPLFGLCIVLGCQFIDFLDQFEFADIVFKVDACQLRIQFGEWLEQLSCFLRKTVIAKVDDFKGTIAHKAFN